VKRGIKRREEGLEEREGLKKRNMGKWK